ncbi:MAG TPA: aminotransferase class III-fold pyridoxal phosphate-dependent enzyme, partial [Gammaproteobacteria bacterium]|nr:aminotransferase class III-fold pyridoxal phosphate-dependent enzyme [Gammaproteobacteria bacterium]
IEPLVQAAGGFIMHTPATLSRIVAAARRHDLLVICDEIATGFGRTGSMFACEQADVVPDIVTLSKALTGGTLPLAATIASTRVYAAFLSDDPEAALMHGPTFCGNPLACAAANASLDLFETEPRLAQCAQIAKQLEAQLEPCRALPGVRDVRVLGAIGVVELERMPDHAALRRAFVARGTWIRPFGRVVYLMPALTIAPDELTILTRAIHDVLSTLGG